MKRIIMLNKFFGGIKIALHNIKRQLVHTSLEQWLSFGIKFDLPQRQLAVVYIGYSIIGTLLLLLPFSTNGEVAFIDNLFTVVSAISTTGLASVDVASQYTFFGQMVILLLIQMGGLGYMTLSSYFMLRMTKRFLPSEKAIFNTQFAFPDTFKSENILKGIVHYTLLFEIIGFVLLCPYFVVKGVEQPVWSALFHSVSAFCTAGFSIYSDNLMQFQSDVYVNIVIMILSIVGALGFITIIDIKKLFTSQNHQLTFTTKVILSITGSLALFGTVNLFFFDSSIASLPLGDRLMASFFQSMSAMTTVGYNTIDVSLMSPLSMFVLTVLMYIGASPSGTGGGLKSTTISALYAYVKNRLGFNKEISLCGRIIPSYRIETAITTALSYTVILFVGIYFMGILEPTESDYLSLSFEAASALATAGLSSGVLATSTIGGKIVLIILMYTGRVGIITLGNAIFTRKSEDKNLHYEDMAV